MSNLTVGQSDLDIFFSLLLIDLMILKIEADLAEELFYKMLRSFPILIFIFSPDSNYFIACWTFKIELEMLIPKKPSIL